MIVLKFGGTSVSSAENIRKVQQIIKNLSQTSQISIVVSAIGGITNKLIKCACYAESGDDSFEDLFDEISNQHMELCNQLLPVTLRNTTIAKVKIKLNELEDVLRGVFLINELSARTCDHIISYGEVLSSNIIFDYLKSENIDISYLNTAHLIKTDTHFGNASVDKDLSYKNILDASKDRSHVTISPGFIASAKDGGYTTTLGRGGSDYTASIIASALHAKELQIWTDVDGMMTANPKLVRLARPIKVLTYEEAMELSHFGAKVIYPPTIQPVLEKKIPISIKNTFKPDYSGTLITHKVEEYDGPAKGITSIDDVALCTLTGSGMLAVPKFSYRFFRALSHNEINIIMITQASSEHSITIAISSEDAEKATSAINNEFEYEIEHRKINPLLVENELSIVAVVGSNMKQQIGISANLFDTLSNNGINVRAIAQGSTELNISVVIAKKDLKKGLNSIHENFFLSKMKKINMFMVGVGNVGSVFLNQIKEQKQYLMDNHQIELIIAGLANSKNMLFNDRGINLVNWQQQLDESDLNTDIDTFIDEIKSLNLRNSVFIDCTANKLLPTYYADILKHSISIVTPNKIACSSSQEDYETLKKTARRYKAKFLYETNVGAGLPVISTLNDLVKSGDSVHKIEAVLSGTLNYIFNNYDGKTRFSEVVRKAQKEGYTEPDPRIDLSGIDVMRKILILARESGYKLELEDIQNQSFIPKECNNQSNLDDYLNTLDNFEEDFKSILEKAKNENKKLKYIAVFDNGNAVTKLQSFDAQHPFYHLDGKDNIVLYYTKRYPKQPLVIRGAGAGSDVTASGIFADIMRIASA